ncbi:TAXI family TRAP transporter solute-binding subunit [Planosporangium flavigriseum]|uniref:C4-dicarboxylate ABC transporter substrate-binding protein n=1 Tax=Planosporangium flavigriseum TaxID=373681 RepID=A0A8J3PMC5_9ACTN|nr:TAXI family TRAP transporter solute-binding subunit [Planosporangium flavigriseum]NJC66426.1 TAXI family TRAP transporter solute-binding subunit [Planosporangium flavigriseum]GIG74164.1 C4-dicarboxylate ABC transporter substrate-binding protein [Planosporangium flavigriseum]
MAVGVTLLAVTVAGSAACGGRRSGATAEGGGGAITCRVDKETRLAMATGNATGVYYALGNAYALQVKSNSANKIQATAAETGASVQNIQQLVAGEYQVAFSLFDTAIDAVQGKGSFDGKKQSIQALARIYDNYTHVIVRADSGINSMADMKGKRISTGSPKSGTEVIAWRLLKAAGVDPEKDITPQRLDLAKSVDGMKDGSIDGLVWSGGLPTPGITDLFTTLGDKVKFVEVTGLLTKLRESNQAYQAASIPASTYRTRVDIPTIVVPNVLLAKGDLDGNVACVLVRTLFDRHDELIKANAAAKGISLETARKTDPVPLHRGAQEALDKLGAK